MKGRTHTETRWRVVCTCGVRHVDVEGTSGNQVLLGLDVGNRYRVSLCPNSEMFLDVPRNPTGRGVLWTIV